MDDSVQVSKELKYETQASKRRWVGMAFFFFFFLGFVVLRFMVLWEVGDGLRLIFSAFYVIWHLWASFLLLFSCGIYRKVVHRKTVVTVRIEANVGKQKNEGPPSDFWSWRKYGQKPIKGSPYPRFSFTFFP